MNIPLSFPPRRVILLTAFVLAVVLSGPAHAWDRYLPELALNALYEAAQEHERQERMDEAFEAYGELAQRAREWDFSGWVSTALWLQAAHRQRQGRLTVALELYEEAWEYLRKSMEKKEGFDPENEWMLLANLRSAQAGLGLVNQVLVTHRRMESYAKRIGAVESDDELTALYDGSLAFASDRDAGTVLIDLALGENELRIRRGEMERALDTYAHLRDHLEGWSERPPEVDGRLARVYSGLISVTEFVEEDADVSGMVEILFGLPDGYEATYFQAYERIREAARRFADGETALEEALKEAEEGIRELEEYGNPALVLEVRRFIVYIHGEAGQPKESLELIDEMLEDSGEVPRITLTPLIVARAEVLAEYPDEPGTKKAFWEALDSIRSTGNFAANPFIYERYARYLDGTAAGSEALHYARLGHLHSSFHEKTIFREKLTDAVEEWADPADEGERNADVEASPPIVRQTVTEHTAMVPGSVLRSPFDFTVVRYNIGHSEEDAGANFRARSSEPVRLEFYDPHAGRLIAVDATGDGGFDGEGEVAFDDESGDGLPELPRGTGDETPGMTLFVYPSAHDEPEKGSPMEEVVLTIEVERNGNWQTWAETRLVFADSGEE